MSKTKRRDSSQTLSERLKRLAQNNWLYVILVCSGAVIIYLNNLVPAIESLWVRLHPPPKPVEVTMLVTVDKGKGCGASGSFEGQEMVQATTLDVAINNTTRRNIMVTSAKLRPEWLTGAFWAGELEEGPIYEVKVDNWWQLVMDAQTDPDKYATLLAAGKAKKKGETVFVKPEPIDVTEIVAKKYTVARQKAERFQIRLGLKRSIDYLEGTIVLEIETDSGHRLNSGPLQIAICEPQ